MLHADCSLLFVGWVLASQSAVPLSALGWTTRKVDASGVNERENDRVTSTSQTSVAQNVSKESGARRSGVWGKSRDFAGAGRASGNTNGLGSNHTKRATTVEVGIRTSTTGQGAPSRVGVGSSGERSSGNKVHTRRSSRPVSST